MSEIDLSDDQKVVLWNLSTRKESGNPKQDAPPPIEGKWEYDAQSKRYSIALNGKTETYSLLSPAHEPMCILFKGDIRAADLREAWFSSSGDDGPPSDDRERPDPY